MERNATLSRTQVPTHSTRDGRPFSPSKQFTSSHSSRTPGGKGVLTFSFFFFSSPLTTSGYSLLSALSHAVICSCASTEEDKQTLDSHTICLETYNRHLDACLSLSISYASPPLIVHVFSMLCCVFHTFTTSNSAVSGVKIINMIYCPCSWVAGKSNHSTGQDTAHFTPAMLSQVFCRQ